MPASRTRSRGRTPGARKADGAYERSEKRQEVDPAAGGDAPETHDDLGKATRIRTQLDGIYPDPLVPLDHSDPFTLLVAVLLSAQCTDARVNLVTPGLFAKGGTPHAMAALAETDILESIKTCGLAPTKAKNIKRLAERLVDEHGGVVPRGLPELEDLPGVGHKTASVVVSQAFGIPAFPVDTHIFRLAHRWGLSTGKTVEKVEADLRRQFPEASWNRLHLQIIYFGREYCPAKRHDPAACPICSWAAPDPLPTDLLRGPRGPSDGPLGAEQEAELLRGPRGPSDGPLGAEQVAE